MKSSDGFRDIISSHLNGLAAKDPLFAETLKKPNKNIEECITFILAEVQKSGCAGFADSEIFGMAVHYYDEDDVKPGKRPNAKVVVNHTVELSDEDKERAKQQAFDNAVVKEQERLKRKQPIKKENPAVVQQSLF